MKPFPRTVPAAVLVAFVALAAATVAVAQEAGTSQRPPDVMADALREMAAQAKNARIRLDANMRSMARDAGTATPAPTEEDLSRGGRIGETSRPESGRGSGKPSQCCGRNVEAMVEGLRTVEAVLAEYGRRLEGDPEARAKLMTMLQLWKDIEGNLTLFDISESKDLARSAIGAVSGSIADLERVHVALVACCVEDGPRKNRQ